MMQLLSIVLAGLSRAIVGEGAGSRWLMYPPSAALAAWVGLGMTWWALAFGIVVVLVMALGYTEWENKQFMAFRYGFVPMGLTILYGSYTGEKMLTWGIACMVVGLFYNQLKVWATSIPWKHRDRIPEFIAGSIIIGGIAFFNG